MAFILRTASRSGSFRQAVPRQFAVMSRAMSTGYNYLEETRKGSSIWITLTRPEVHNAFDENVIEELTRVYTDIAARNTDATAVVLTGTGKSFSAGADLNWMAKMAKYTEEENKADSDKLFAMFAAIKDCPLPTIARVNGHALGGGAGLVASCDMAFTVRKALIGFTEVNIGLIPAVISKFVMEKIGKTHASRFFLTGERFNGQVAEKIGLAQESFETQEELDAAVEDITKKISRASPQAVRRAKVLIEEVDKMASVHDTRGFVTGQIASIRVSEEGQEGLKSFLESRKPSWIV